MHETIEKHFIFEEGPLESMIDHKVVTVDMGSYVMIQEQSKVLWRLLTEHDNGRMCCFERTSLPIFRRINRLS